MVGLARSKFDASLTWQLFQAVFLYSVSIAHQSLLSEHAIIFTFILPYCHFSKLLFGHLSFYQTKVKL